MEKTILLSFDVEEFMLPLEYNQKISQEKMFEISFEGLKKVLKILDKYNIKATFFTTAIFALKYPEIIKKLSNKHEIASHGYSHTEKDMQIKKTKKILEKIIGKKI